MLTQVLLKEVTIMPTIVWPQAKLQGANTAPPISRKFCIKDLLWAWPHPLEQDLDFPHSQSLLSGSYHSLLFLCNRGQAGTRGQVANIHWIRKKQENSRKTYNSASLTTLKPLTVWITTNWKILKEMGMSEYLTCLLRNLYAGQEAS